MIATAVPTASTYPNGRVYSLARGRYAPRRQLEDRMQVGAAVGWLLHDRHARLTSLRLQRGNFLGSAVRHMTVVAKVERALSR